MYIFIYTYIHVYIKIVCLKFKFVDFLMLETFLQTKILQ